VKIWLCSSRSIVHFAHANISQTDMYLKRRPPGVAGLDQALRRHAWQTRGKGATTENRPLGHKDGEPSSKDLLD
jgi:hypothetical protein